MSFATRLRELRVEKGLSREELSARSGIPRATIRDYEQGRREPSLRFAFQVAEGLGVSVEAFRDLAAQQPEPSGEKKPARGKGKKRQG